MGVNVAARLEALAEPGGICISGTVYDQVRDKLAYPFEDRGEQQVKNISRPVRVYALPAGTVVTRGEARIAHRTAMLRTTTLRFLVVVLPFDNLSSDAEQQFFADGITDDLTTDLSRIVGLFVISRNTAFTYQNMPVTVRRVGREPNVR
jgi:hypothetical protein